MKLVLLRHASRNAHELGDPPLNSIGLIQAESLVQAIAPSGILPTPSLLLTSPKRRAKETLLPTASKMNIPLNIDARLDERHSEESSRAFENRVRETLENLPSLIAHSTGRDCGACIWICSHLDWLESALLHLPSNLSETEVSMSWSTAQYRVFKLQKENGIWMSQGEGRGKESP
jgi:phosphohistidine phosphatase SixA